MLSKVDHVVVGSGFAGSLVARILSKAGRSVLLLDRARHPRFALGESTTPLANIALERLARRYDLPELDRLAAHGRWMRSFPEVGRGLKRGFSFYLHEAGREWRRDPDRRLLVGASPSDAVADVHWLRSDVDRLLARFAVADGTELWQETEVLGVEAVTGGLRLELRRDGGTRSVVAASVVDASGPAGAVACRLGATRSRTGRTASHLVYGHFRDVALLGEVAGSSADDAPYPEDWAAVHHLLEEGWLYLLRFDDGLVSAGVLLDAGVAAEPALGDPTAVWRRLLGRYPTLTALFASARPELPIAAQRHVQHRLSRAVGPGWVATPHTFGFVDPLFSTGIAWGLRGVERLAEVLTTSPPDLASGGAAELLARYETLLAAEIEQLDRLVSAAYRARRDFDLFTAESMLYFAWVSHAESRERLREPPRVWWDGFLGAGDPAAERLFAEACARVDEVAAGGATSGDFAAWVARRIEPFNVAGLMDPARRNLYPADPGLLVREAHKLGLEPAAVEAALPSLLRED